MSTATQETTAEQLLKMPDDGFRYELVRESSGKSRPLDMSMGKLRCGWAGGYRSMWKQTVSVGFLPLKPALDFPSIPISSGPPDVAFVARERAERIDRPNGYWPGAPDLAIEVSRPRTLTAMSKGRSSNGSPRERPWSRGQFAQAFSHGLPRIQHRFFG